MEKSNGITQMDSLELINAGKQLQAMATVAGLHCPQYKTAFGLRMAAKILYLAQIGPRLNDEMKRQFEQDLETIRMIAEGERAELYNKLITALEKAADTLEGLKGVTDMHGIAILHDNDVEQIKWWRNLLHNSRKADPNRIQ